MQSAKIIEWANKADLLIYLQNHHPQIIAVDGIDGVGKSASIAPFLKNSLNGRIISVDDFLQKKRGGYLKYLNYHDLERSIKSNCADLLIIEGVQLLSVVSKIRIEPDCVVYVCDRQWLDEWEKYCQNKKPFRKIVKQKEEEVNRFNRILDGANARKYQLEGLRREIYCYTYRFYPFSKADVILLMSKD